ncbi:hypothetical protein LWI29_032003 [Acer saccharum]|uniref:Uncharacterized protein n=1 Tax=Acer saccharum TaxID=4024 RepID=A0AA39SAL3_ACESA|nr:hypothetical protein LWI29_032003 [Acer saccharum]
MKWVHTTCLPTILPSGCLSVKMEGTLDLPSKAEAQKKNGLIWGAPSSNKYWKGSWFFVEGNWGKKPSDDPDGAELNIPCHFCEARTYTDQPKLTKDEANRVSQAVQTMMDSRNFKTLVTAEKLKTFALIPELFNNHNHSKYILLREYIFPLFMEILALSFVVLDLDPILGKTICALKNMKAVSKEDAKAAEK